MKYELWMKMSYFLSLTEEDNIKAYLSNDIHKNEKNTLIIKIWYDLIKTMYTHTIFTAS